MSFGKLFTFVFGIIFIILLYVIIYYALKIMYKDVKTGGKAKNNNSGIRYGIEVIQTGVNSTLEQGAVVQIFLRFRNSVSMYVTKSSTTEHLILVRV